MYNVHTHTSTLHTHTHTHTHTHNNLYMRMWFLPSQFSIVYMLVFLVMTIRKLSGFVSANPWLLL